TGVMARSANDTAIARARDRQFARGLAVGLDASVECEPLLAMLRGRGVRIVAESVGVALRENLHHPAIKIVDRVIHDEFEPPIVFSVSFLNVIPQPYADILVLSAETHLLRSQHLNILHRNFGHPIRAAVK